MNDDDDDSRHGITNGIVQSLLSFAAHLQRTAESESNVPAALPSPTRYLKAFPLPQVEISANRVALDRQGTQLWNLCRNLGWNKTEPEHSSLAQIRALAFFMIESAQKQTSKALRGSSRLARLGLAAAKLCLHCKQHELVSLILERVAIYVEEPSKSSSRDRPILVADHDFGQSYLQYLCLRLALSWQQGRLDLAEHFFATMDLTHARSTASVAEDRVDLFFEIGKSLLDKGCYDMAVVWLKRASKLLQDQNLESLSSDAGELRLNLLHTYARALYCLESSEAHDQATEILEILLREYGNKLVVRLLQLDIISRAENPNSESYHAALNAISMMIHLTEQNLSMILHFVHQLRKYSTELACHVLKRFLLQRLVPHGNEDWVTRTFITLLWMSTSGPSPNEHPSELRHHLDDLFKAWKRCLSPEATHGSLVLLWKRIEDSFDHGRFQDTIDYCELALHKLLEKTGHINVDKIERRLVLCYLETSDLEACHRHVSRLLESKILNPLNYYLAYCLALKTKDVIQAREALTALNSAANVSEQLLYACISKTLQTGTSEQAANVLLSLLNKYDFNPPKHISLPTLLRCTIRLYLPQLRYEAGQDQQSMDTILRLFAAVPEALQGRSASTHQGDHQRSVSVSQDSFPATEINWFLTNCYNLAVKAVLIWPASAVIRLFETVIQITSHRTRLETGSKNDVVFENDARKCLCHFAMAIIYVAEGRQCHDHDNQVENYRNALTSVADFDKAYQMLQQHVPDLANDQEITRKKEETFSDLNSKQQVLLPLEFEAAMHQHPHISDATKTTPKNPHHLSAIISKAHDLRVPRKFYGLFADIILFSTHPPLPHDEPEPEPDKSSSQQKLPPLSLSTASVLLTQIIATARTLPDYNTVRASRWIRCLVQLCLDQHHHDQGNNPENTSHHDQAPPPPPPPPTEDERNQNPLLIIEDVVIQAILLARECLHNRSESHETAAAAATTTSAPDSFYPPDELEYLSTTLFNLGVDFWLASVSTAHNTHHHDNNNNDNATKDTGVEEVGAVVEAKRWISIAVEIADLLAEYGVERGGGDRGSLRRVLRAKVREGIGGVGWEFLG